MPGDVPVDDPQEDKSHFEASRIVVALALLVALIAGVVYVVRNRLHPFTVGGLSLIARTNIVYT